MRDSYRTDRLLIVDLELTCWDQPEPPPGQVPDIIEIGLAEVDNHALTVSRTGRFLVRPARSQVSPFCTELTGIAPDDLRRSGRPFREVARSVIKEFAPLRKTWAAWGTDRNALAEAAAFHQVDCPLSDSFLDLGHLFGLLSGARQRVALSDALTRLGLVREGVHHRAVDDAVNAARVYIELVRRHRAAMAPGADPRG